MGDDRYVSQPLALEGAYNVRDLGNYRTEGGACTRAGMFLRGDGLHSLTRKDKEYLYRYGVRCIIDMRAPIELERQPCCITEQDAIAYYNVPLLDNIHSGSFEDEFPKSLGELYIGLLSSSRDHISRVLKIIAGYPEVCVLFNCTAGKDRTGIIAMLLLKLAGVADKDVIADYAASGDNIRAVLYEQKAALETGGRVLEDYLFESCPDDMAMALTYLETACGSARNYMQTLGLTGKEIETVQRKLIGG